MTLHRLVFILFAGLLAAAPPTLANCTLASNVPEVTPDADFTDNGDGTVTHAQSGLIWKRCAEGQTWSGVTCTGTGSGHDWANALIQAKNSTYAGYTDWRLPSRSELESIVETGCATFPTINTTLFPLAPSGGTWSSTSFAYDTALAWYANFYDGSVSAINKPTSGGFVRLVRDGKSLGAFDASSSGNALTVTSINSGTNPEVNADFDVVVTSAANVAADTPVTLRKNTGAGNLGGTTTCTIPSGNNTCTVTGATWNTGETGARLAANAEGFTSSRSAAFDVDALNQTISFDALAGKTYGDADFTVAATASSGLTVSFTSQTSSVCTVTGTTVTLVAVGTCTIRASQAGNASYNAAPDVDQGFLVEAKTLAVTGLSAASKPYDGTTAATITGTPDVSAGVVGSDTVSVTGTAVGSFADAAVANDKTVTVTGLSLTGADSGNYLLEDPITLTASITTAPVTVTLGGLSHAFDGTQKSATCSTSPAVSYSLGYSDVGSGTGRTGVGSYGVTCTVTQANYAGSASDTLVIAAASQTITFTPPDGVVGEVISLSATGGDSGNPVTFARQSGPCTLSGSSLTLTGVGSCVVRASQAGNADYAAATPVDATVTVSQADTTTSITGHTPDPSPAAQPIQVSFTVTVQSPGAGTPTGNVTVSDGTDSCTASVAAGGCELIPSTPGAKTLTAHYVGESRYAASDSTGVDHTVVVSKSYTGNNPNGPGTLTASFTGGGDTCSYSRSRFITAFPAAPPAGQSFPYGLFDFVVSGCDPGATLNFTIQYPAALPAGSQYWKYGPTAASGLDNPVWYTLTAADNVVQIGGSNTVTFSITDGGLGDDDLNATNGEIVDQGGPGNGGGAAGAAPIPVLSPLGWLMLTGLLGMLGVLTRCRQDM